MKRISFIAAAALMLVGAQLHAQARTDSKKAGKPAVVAAKAAGKSATVAKGDAKASATVKPAGGTASTRPKRSGGKKTAVKSGAKKDSTAKKP